MQKKVFFSIGILAGIVVWASSLYQQMEYELIIVLPDKPVTYVADQSKIEPIPLTKTVAMSVNDEWFGTDQMLTSYEWDIFAQVLMAEARGENFQVQYYIACVILNRVNSPLFPNTIAGVIYQTEPAVQFYGAWDTEHYEVSDSVWEAIQAALIHNDLPEDVYYFTSEGYLSGTEPWQQIGNMWFSRQK